MVGIDISHTVHLGKFKGVGLLLNVNCVIGGHPMESRHVTDLSNVIVLWGEEGVCPGRGGRCLPVIRIEKCPAHPLPK